MRSNITPLLTAYLAGKASARYEFPLDKEGDELRIGDSSAKVLSRQYDNKTQLVTRVIEMQYMNRQCGMTLVTDVGNWKLVSVSFDERSSQFGCPPALIMRELIMYFMGGDVVIKLDGKDYGCNWHDDKVPTFGSITVSITDWEGNTFCQTLDEEPHACTAGYYLLNDISTIVGMFFYGSPDEYENTSECHALLHGRVRKVKVKQGGMKILKVK